MAKGCSEVDWHRHWLSLLRSKGIVGLRVVKRKKKKRRKGRRWVRGLKKQNHKLDETHVSYGCADFGFCATFSSDWANNQTCFLNSNPLGEKARVKQIPDQQGGTVLGIMCCTVFKLVSVSWSLFRTVPFYHFAYVDIVMKLLIRPLDLHVFIAT